jgi:hypothetical protein
MHSRTGFLILDIEFVILDKTIAYLHFLEALLPVNRGKANKND